MTISESLERIREMRDTLLEAIPRKLTPYQKAQAKRRQTVAAHTANPAKQSAMYKHAVRAIFQKLRKSGDSFAGAAKGGQNIAKHMMAKNGYASGQESGAIKLTGKGRRRNRMHLAEPKGIRDKKEKAYNWIMGIQARKAADKEAVRRKTLSAG